VTTNPDPISLAKAHQSANLSGEHGHWFGWSNVNMPIASGDKLFVYVYLNPASPPTEIMVSWSTSSSWDHRAYWGADSLPWAGRTKIGELPSTGEWVRLEFDASAIGMAGQTATGMGFTCFGGQATWDRTGKSSPSGTAAPAFSPGGGTYSSSQTVTITSATSGASIYYTTNGSTPTSSSTLYTTPVAISTTTTLKAIAYKSGLADSSVTSATYIINTDWDWFDDALPAGAGNLELGDDESEPHLPVESTPVGQSVG
jgi:hypothetical protein